MDALLLGEQQLRIARLGPEVDHLVHRRQELARKRRARLEAGVLQHRLVARVATERPPLLLHVGRGEPLDVLERLGAVRRIRDDRDALAAELRALALRPGRIDEEADLVATDVRVLVEAREEGEPVHHHRHLARLERVQALAHVRVGQARRRAALVELLVELEALHGIRTVDEAVHRVVLLRILVLEAIWVEDVAHAHRDAFGAALGEEVGAVDLLAVDGAGEELSHLLELGPGLRRLELAVVFLLEFGAQLGPGEPVLAVGPAERVAHRRQGPVVRRALGPLRIAEHRRRHEVAHLDSFLGEEIVQLHVVAALGRAADPLAVADDHIAELPLRIELVEHPVGEVRPGHELELHVDLGLGGELLAQFDQRVGRIPGGPAERDRLALGLRSAAAQSQDSGRCDRQRGGQLLVDRFHLGGLLRSGPGHKYPTAAVAIAGSRRSGSPRAAAPR